MQKRSEIFRSVEALRGRTLRHSAVGGGGLAVTPCAVRPCRPGDFLIMKLPLVAALLQAVAGLSPPPPIAPPQPPMAPPYVAASDARDCCGTAIGSVIGGAVLLGIIVRCLMCREARERRKAGADEYDVYDKGSELVA